ncbi:glycoside hydrolase family 35 protein [Rhizoctonia solani 123E]|uniref:beta-galactosidase n=1 Tax=Rhizoctonia solani 123E TaxID=1423351 RepID=A0A074REE9_9AGAM|nr:glycoside hydrolase family 35 protein [Rhizoctonia solani 123E]
MVYLTRHASLVSCSELGQTGDRPIECGPFPTVCFVIYSVDLSELCRYIPSPGSPGFYAGNSSVAVTFDQHSLLLDGKRVMIFSGEFHPWRLPSTPLWRDVLEKMKAGGFNAVSIYFHWGLTESKRGVLNFEGHRSVTRFLDVARDVGILVIVRPGPYINAETAGGGYPGWLSNVPDTARSNGSDYTAAWKPYIQQVSRFVAPYQYPNGPVILMQSENEYSMDNPSVSALTDGNEADFVQDSTTYGHTDHMQWIIEEMRANGITRVPITHNDRKPDGQFASGRAKVDLYAWDAYPLGFDVHTQTCEWKQVDTSLDASHQRRNPAEPLYLAKYQGGAFDPWGGPGYDACYQLINEQFANVFYKNNHAAGAYLQNLYMTYGGTNWGHLATPTVYTSYDYAAPISEDRSLTPKYSEIKLQSLFLHATPHYHLAGRISNDTAHASLPYIFTTHLATPAGQNLYIVRQTSTTRTARAEFDLRVNTTRGEVLLQGVVLDGRESKVLVSEYPFGTSVLAYSSAEVATWTTLDGHDHIFLYANSTIRAALYTHSPTTTVSDSSVTVSISNGTALISGTPSSGLVRVTVGTTSVWLANKAWLAPRTWQPRVSHTSGNGKYDLSPRTGSILVFGPYLVRNATLIGSTLALTGDLKPGTTDLELVVPFQVKFATFNRKPVHMSRSLTGTLKGSIDVPNLALSLPSLEQAEWKCTDSLPELGEFDDSSWVLANKTTTSRPGRFQPLGGAVLFSAEYGFHHGHIVYRGRFTGNATGVQFIVQGGYNFAFSAFLNGRFLGSGEGRGANDPAGGLDKVNVTYTFDHLERENVITVVVDNMGLEQDWNSKDEFKAPRGIRGYELFGGDFSSWKIAGSVERNDTLRGPMNQGGLYVERIGATDPDYSTSSWPLCSPFVGIDRAGVVAYKTGLKLDIPKDWDVPLAFKFTRTSGRYRVMLYVNGWQFGKYVANMGPQVVFPVPEGVLDHRGENDAVLILWSLDPEGAKVDVRLVATNAVVSGKGIA